MKKALLSIVLISSVMFAQDPIIVSPDTLDYGNILMGNTSSMSFTITANLDQTISITPPSFYSVDTSEIAMTSGETQDIVVTFDPPQIGNYDSQIVLTGSTFGNAVVVVTATAVNYLEGSLSGTISAEFSPYEISGDIYVEEGNTLTIEPGVELQFTGDYGFTINGDLIAEGKPDSLITFTSSASNEFWGGISIVNSDNSNILYCDINDVGNSFSLIDNFSDLSGWSGGSLSYSEFISNPTSLLLEIAGGETYSHLNTPVVISSDSTKIDFVYKQFSESLSSNSSYRGVLYLQYYNEENDSWSNIDYFYAPFSGQSNYLSDWIFEHSYIDVEYYSNITIGDTLQLRFKAYNNTTGSYIAKFYIDDFEYESNSKVAPVKITNCNTSISNTVIHSSKSFEGIHLSNANSQITNVILKEIMGTGIRNIDSYPLIFNSIIWGNGLSEITGKQIDIISGNPTISHTLIQNYNSSDLGISGQYSDGGGNLDQNPAFSDEMFHLGIFSPCIDAGHPNDYDACMPPGLGTLSADMGMYGGLNNCGTEESNIGGGEPTIITIEDLPQDQGGFVGLQFAGSFYDGGSDIYDITHYSIWRELDTEGREEISYNTSPVGAYYHPNNRENEAWEYIGESPAQEFDIYGYTAPTLADSNYIGQFWSKFLVVAHTTDEAVFFVSLSDSGYSVDNLSPAAPGNFVASIVDTSIILDWDENDVMDLDYYTVYRSTDSELIISEENLLANTTDTLFTDMTAIWNTNYFYQLTCTDYNGNVSGASNFVEAFITVNYAPTIDSIDDIETNEDTPVEIEITVNDENEDSLSITVMSSDENVNPILEGYTLNLNLTANWHGTSEITVTVSDGECDVTEVFVLNIISVNDAPGGFTLISPENETMVVLTNETLGDTLRFDWSASTDIEGDSLSYTFEFSNESDVLIEETTDDLSIGVEHSFFSNAMDASTSMNGSWSVTVTDGQDSVFSDNGPFTITIDGSELAIDPMDLIPQVFALHQNYPNPFNPVTTLRYDLPKHAHVSLIIYDIMGREVQRLVHATQETGFKSVLWNGTNELGKPVSAGMYLYRISAGDFHQVKKMVLLK